MTMSRSDRARANALDAALRDRKKDITAVDTRTLRRLNAAGFAFRSIAEAAAYQDRLRATARANAALIDMQDEISRRKAS